MDRRHARALRAGLLASVVLHVLVFLPLGRAVPVPPSPYAAAGERRGSDRAAAGGGMQAIELATPMPEPAATPPPVPVPVPTLEVPPAEEEEVQLESPTLALAPGMESPGEPGPRPGPGLPTGTGEGDGGTEAEGLFRVIPPQPRGFGAPPADRPGSVRGKEIEIWVYVSAAGRVVPDSTRLLPPTGDRRYDRRLRDYASEWLFEPARKDGRPVSEWFRYTLVM